METFINDVQFDLYFGLAKKFYARKLFRAGDKFFTKKRT